MMEAFDLDQPLKLSSFAVFDLETTGLSSIYGHRVCEVACLRLRDGLEVGRCESLVDPGRPISPGAFQVNRITAEMLVGAPPFPVVAGLLLELMEGAVLVAHNAPFDLSFLAAELELAGLAPPEGPVVDTLVLTRRIYGFARNGLSALTAALGLETGPVHRAMGDVWTTRNLLERLLWDLEYRWSVTTLGSLLEFQGGSIPYPCTQALPLPPAIAKALERRGQVQMCYVDARGLQTVRTIRPLRVQEQRGHLYLLAHCQRADALRTFRLDRIVEMVPKD